MIDGAESKYIFCKKKECRMHIDVCSTKKCNKNCDDYQKCFTVDIEINGETIEIGAKEL